VKLFFLSASPDWPGVYMTVYHLLNSPLLTGHTQSTNNDPSALPAQGFQLFWDGNYTVEPTGDAASYGALIGYKVKRGELIGFAGTVPVPDGVASHSFADFYFDVPDISVNPNIKTGDIHLHLFNLEHSFTGKVIALMRFSPAGCLLIHLNVTAISFRPNNTMSISSTLQGNKIGTILMLVIQGVVI